LERTRLTGCRHRRTHERSDGSEGAYGAFSGEEEEEYEGEEEGEADGEADAERQDGEHGADGTGGLEEANPGGEGG